MSESIQAPKRKYTRKSKVVEPIAEPLVNSDSEQSTTSTDSGLTPPEQVPQKPKRVYKKKVAISEPVEPVDEIPPPTPLSYGAQPIPVLERQTNNVEDSPPSSPEPVKEKKPRTEKQQEAFRKMREARLKKTEELKKLKDLEKEQKQLEREQSKLNTITEKVVEKATELKQRKTRKPRAEPNEVDVLPEPQRVPQIIQEKTIKPYIFV
jgi:hypothetical protein